MKPKVIATFKSYPGMLAAMRLRAQQQKLIVGSDNVAHVTGLPAQYLSKLLSPNPPRRLGMISMEPVLAVLGVKLVMIEDAEAIARYGPRLHKRNDNFAHGGAITVVFSRRHMRKIGQAGAQKRWDKVRARSAAGLKAATARWSNNRELPPLGSGPASKILKSK